MLYNPLCDSLKPEYSPIKKIGKWTILVKNKMADSLIVTDDFYTYYGIIYQDSSVAYDMPERLPETVKSWIRNQYAPQFKVKCNGYTINFNTFYKYWQISHKNIGANIAEFKSLNDALIYCENG